LTPQASRPPPPGRRRTLGSLVTHEGSACIVSPKWNEGTPRRPSSSFLASWWHGKRLRSASLLAVSKVLRILAKAPLRARGRGRAAIASDRRS
jgi:hypothetical protein